VGETPMISKVFLSALAAVCAMAVIAAQDPSFEFPAAKHVGFDEPREAPELASLSTENVTVSFKNATAGEVLDWLKEHGVNYVVPDDQLDKSKTVNINIVNQPIEDVLKALASGWGGRWTKTNEVWTFHRGGVFMPAEGVTTVRDLLAPQPSVELPAKTRNWATTPMTKEQQAELEKALKNNKAWTTAPLTKEQRGEMEKAFKFMPPMPAMPAMPGGVFVAPKPMTPEQKAQFEKAMQGMGDPKKWEEFQRQWEKWGEKFEKNFKFDEKSLAELEKQGKVKRYELKPGQGGVYYWNGDGKMDAKSMAEMEKKAADLAKQGKAFRYDLKPGQGSPFIFRDGVKMDEKSMAELEKKAADLANQGKAFRYELKPGQASPFFYQDGGKIDAKRLAEIEKKAAEAAKQGQKFRYELKPGKDGVYYWNGKELKGARGLTIPSTPRVAFGSANDMSGIYDSLTTMQRDTLKRRGFLYYSDLDAKQRSMIGTMGGGSWTISFKDGNKEITIKSDK
jgi:hypothetical protein